ncbi:TadE/TadG family type IV pilus assembly protein [Pannonibacter sp. SL95]|uniref:TadE/TadG family type IV pilus assembly protein n=1 Tax=Pannonibacter sp. SL95 TaxID=2995153 RepID=UPI002275DF0A|nr:TadE/TadG family type IV pilus assembly protein [Pannonibacter sp. SL95]MCY1706729.1 pilus assembly protein [Pannonibacter sp. SL95]
MRSPFLTRLVRKLRGFAGETRASILPLFGVLILLMIVIAGAGIDYGRAVMARSSIAHALDSAVLTVARELSVKLMTDAEIATAINKTFAANLESGGLTGISVAPITYSIDPTEGLVTAQTTANVPTNFIFMGGIGPDTIPVSVQAQSTYSLFDIELAMVLDVTGSMRNQMVALRTAATAITDILIPPGTKPDESKVRMSMVPYSQGVNLGSYATTVTSGATSGGNCVTERYGPQKFTDATYNYAGASSNFFGGGSTACPPSTSSIVPLTADSSKLKTAINALKDGGGTGGQMGIAWGWYTLSPNWNNLWPSASRPVAYKTDKMKKIALIMTDGDFNDFYDFTPLDEATCKKRAGFSYGTYQGQSNHDQRSGYYWLPDAKKSGCAKGTKNYWLGQYFTNGNYEDPPSVRARSFCDAMKSKDIAVYTVLFTSGVGSTANAEKLMKYCASSSSTYFKATDSAALISAFQKIANQIQAIYLSK